MKLSKPSIPIWTIPPAILSIETALFAALAAASLDIFVSRPQQGGGSITTLLPGLVYASATVMKFCLVMTVVSALVGVAYRLFAPNSPIAANRRLSVWGITSIALTPSAPLLGALAVLFAQSLIATDNLSASHFSQLARCGVCVMLAIIVAAALASLVSLIRHERPALLSLLGLLTSLILIGLFWYLRFYALDFDQDRWAPRQF